MASVALDRVGGKGAGFWHANPTGSEVNHSTSCAKVKNVWHYTSAPPVCLHDFCYSHTTYACICKY